MKAIGKLIVTALVVFVAGGFLVSPADASSRVTCPERFPQVEWTLVSDGDVAVYAAGVPDAIAERFGGDIELSSGWIVADIGSFETVVCLVGEDAAYIGDEFASGSVGFHAHMDLDDRLLVLETERPSFVGPAAAFGLAHQALWQNNGDEAFPEPLASVIAQWYRARVLERLDQYHHDAKVMNFFDTESAINWFRRDISVENVFDADTTINWTAAAQLPVHNWIPESNFTAVGDFVNFAVSEYGSDVLLETDGAAWTEIEREWKAALRADLTGRETPTTDWVFGVAIAVGILSVAVIAIGLGLYSKYRKKERIATPPPTPGFFSEN